MDLDSTGVRRLALRWGREDLDVIASLRLLAGEPERGVPRPSAVRGEGRGEMCDPQQGRRPVGG